MPPRGCADTEIAAQVGYDGADRGEVAKTVLRRSGLRGSRTSRARVARAVFPPEQVAEVKAIACELPATHGLPLSPLLAH